MIATVPSSFPLPFVTSLVDRKLQASIKRVSELSGKPASPNDIILIEGGHHSQQQIAVPGSKKGIKAKQPQSFQIVPTPQEHSIGQPLDIRVTIEQNQNVHVTVTHQKINQDQVVHVSTPEGNVALGGIDEVIEEKKVDSADNN